MERKAWGGEVTETLPAKDGRRPPQDVEKTSGRVEWRLSTQSRCYT
jgi:hypothetical protein